MSILNYSSKQEAKAHAEDMEGFVEFMEGECEVCGNKRKDCMKIHGDEDEGN